MTVQDLYRTVENDCTGSVQDSRKMTVQDLYRTVENDCTGSVQDSRK